MDETGHISNFLVTDNTMEKGGSGIYTQVATGLNETQKGGETSKSKILRILKKGSPTCIKSTGDKIGIRDGWVIYRLGDVVTSALPLGRRIYQHRPYIVAEVPYIKYLHLIIDST